ncbi:MAG: hypothetical protein JRG80_23130, partial [Deltaproteobacteria bacterium]|nr:hypothetical protein [Deltaproteobacteria bacterium]
RALAIASLLFLAWCVWQVAVSAVFLASLYEGLGHGVAAAITASLTGVVLFTFPIACWGLARTGRAPSARTTTLGVLVLGALAAGGLLHAAAAASARPIGNGLADPAVLVEHAMRWLPDWDALPPPAPDQQAALDPNLPAHCDRSLLHEDALQTVVVHYLAEAPSGTEARAYCAQGHGPDFEQSLRTRLQSEALQRPLKIDWIHAAAPLGSGFAHIAPLGLRPGLDGVCLGPRCLMPWQLLLADRFRAIHPLAEVPDLQFGFSAEEIRAVLAAEDGAVAGSTAWVRIEVKSFVVDGSGQLQQLDRLRSAKPARDPDRFARAARMAEHHVGYAQRRSGRFRYAQMPTTKYSRKYRLNLPRQAGTTLVMCELGQDRESSERVALRSLERMADNEVRSGEHSFLLGEREQRVAELRDSALPLAAYLACRERVGESFDALTDRLGSGILALQRPDGSFAPEFDLDRGEALPGNAPLYVEGQAILALTLLERRAAAHDAAAHERIRDAVEHAMHFVSHQYWDHPLREFFFLEENWHCLAARAALGHHRNTDYEQFCLDYTRFRSRFALPPGSGVAHDFVGGLGFGNLFAPQTVPTAGFAETLAAAIEIHTARGSNATLERELLERALDFLVDQQWTLTSCFACPRPSQIVGGFSESPTSPRLRIDYTQHAWAAIGHGAPLLAAEPT